MNLLTTGLGVLASFLVVWLIVVLALWLLARRHQDLELRDLLRLVPDTIRLMSRLARQGALPTGAKVRVWLLLAYLVMPIDLIPDFIPVLGHLDDVLLIAITLRSVVRISGSDVIEAHWPGTPDGLDLLFRASGLTLS